MVEDDYSTRPPRRLWPFTRMWMFENMENVFRQMENELEELSRKVSKDLMRERTLPSGAVVKEMGPFVYGYSMTVGPDGKPRIREFGNVKPETRMGRPKLDLKEKREPLVDVLRTDGEVQVIIELPGVSKDDIKLRGTEDSLTVSVDTLERKYYKELELPLKVDPKTAESKYINGVLEIIIKRLEKESPEGEPIKID
jgi:HSP20 family protein